MISDKLYMKNIKLSPDMLHVVWGWKFAFEGDFVHASKIHSAPVTSYNITVSARHQNYWK